MNEHQSLLSILNQFHSIDWINQYFDLLKKLLTELQIEEGDKRLAMSIPGNKSLPVNLGQRYILKPMPNEYLRCIVPSSFEEDAVDGKIIFEFRKKGVVDAKWIEVHYPLGASFPTELFYACVDACADIMDHCRRTGYYKHHVPDLYNFTMETAVRNEILDELKKMQV